MDDDKETEIYVPSTSKRCVKCLGIRSTDCKECHPERYCFEHMMPMRHCGKCAKHPSICKHHRRRARCVECAREKGDNKDGTTSSVCIHHRRKYQCTECAKLGMMDPKQRSEICPCGVRKRYCNIHGGANLCIICHETTVFRVGGTCVRCNSINCVDGTKPVRLKKREIEVMEWIAELPPYTAYNKSLVSILRKNVETTDETKLFSWFNLVRDTTSYYPDFMWTLSDSHVLLEIDEHQHKKTFFNPTGGSYKNERQREIDMIEQILCISDKQIVIVRYNPDAFQTGFKPRSKHMSMLTSKDARKTMLLDTLHVVMRLGLKHETIPVMSKRIVYIRLFFDCTCNNVETCYFRHAWGFNTLDEFKSYVIEVGE
jgi:hypothetical protein